MASIDSDPIVRSVAFAALIDPSTHTAEQLAVRAGCIVEQVRPALAALQDDLLLTHEGRSINPRLFNALAASWCSDQPERGIAREPAPGNRNLADLLMLGLGNPEREPGWALGGRKAAAAWNIPIGVVEEPPYHFYVPSETYLRIAVQELGPADGAGIKAFIRATPMFWITGHRFDAAIRRLSDTHWPIVHPLVAALEVAVIDRSILDAWRDVPPEVSHRPWNV